MKIFTGIYFVFNGFDTPFSKNLIELFTFVSVLSTLFFYS